MGDELVLVTGGSGFIGAHCMLALAGAGYRVRSTVRSLEQERGVRAMLALGGAPETLDLSFAVADLDEDGGWSAALEGCDYVLHVASPFPAAAPAQEDALIGPARDGTLRVLNAARDAGVKRVVLTSSFAAVGYGHEATSEPFNEEAWSQLGAGVSAYVKSKTLAEGAAWNFVAHAHAPLELAVVNPVVVFGPPLGPRLSTSLEIVRRMMRGEIPLLPRISFGVVDVRDVADLHLRAMTNPAAAGERFLATAGLLSMRELASVLRSHLGAAARRVPTRAAPDLLVRLLATVNPLARQAVPELGMERRATSEHAKRLLGWEPRPREDAVVATAQSLAALGLLR